MSTNDMIEELKNSLWNQFGAAIDMLGEALDRWPHELLCARCRAFYLSYHSLVFLDYYLTVPPRDFSAHLPFHLRDPEDLPPEAVDDLFPVRTYTKAELQGYVRHCREKARLLIEGLSAEGLQARFVEEPEMGTKDYSVVEILLYNLRHVQHHTAQLNLMLRHEIGQAGPWVSRADTKLFS